MEWIVLRLYVMAWALWFGGLVTLFLSVSTVFKVLDPDRQAAGKITAPIFNLFERNVAVPVALVALISALYLYIRRKTRARLISLALLILACAVSTGSTLLVSTKIETLRQAGQTQTQEFRTLHGLSMGLYSSVTLLLALAALPLPSLMRRDPLD